MANRNGQPSNAEIAAQALRYIDEQGLDGFSMRKFAEYVGIPVMTISNRFGSKEALLKEALSCMLAETSIDKVSGESWSDDLRRVARMHRRMALAHPGAFPLFLSVPAYEEPMLAYTSRVFATHEGQGLPEDMPAVFLSVMHSFLSVFQLAESFENQPSEEDRAKLADPASPTSRVFPLFNEQSFERNLDIIIAGLAAQYHLPLQ